MVKRRPHAYPQDGCITKTWAPSSVFKTIFWPLLISGRLAEARTTSNSGLHTATTTTTTDSYLFVGYQPSITYPLGFFDVHITDTHTDMHTYRQSVHPLPCTHIDTYTHPLPCTHIDTYAHPLIHTDMYFSLFVYISLYLSMSTFLCLHFSLCLPFSLPGRVLGWL